MRTLLFCFVLVFVNINIYCQDYVKLKQKKIEKKIEKWLNEKNRKFTKSSTDSSLSYNIKDSISQEFGFNFYFDKYNRCIIEEQTFNCDSCLQKFLQFVLKRKFMNWKQIDGGYKVGFPYSLYLQVFNTNNVYKLKFTYKGWKDKVDEN